MIEITLVLVALVAVGLVGFIGAAAAPGLIAAIGLGTLLLGLAVGVPTGFWYHVILYRCVSQKLPLSGTWWLSPATLHRHLTLAEERRIRPWYRTGGVGFVLCLVGGIAAIAGLLLGR
jgi:hypothetical protein